MEFLVFAVPLNDLTKFLGGFVMTFEKLRQIGDVLLVLLFVLSQSIADGYVVDIIGLFVDGAKVAP